MAWFYRPSLFILCSFSWEIDNWQSWELDDDDDLGLRARQLQRSICAHNYEI